MDSEVRWNNFVKRVHKANLDRACTSSTMEVYALTELVETLKKIERKMPDDNKTWRHSS